MIYERKEQVVKKLTLQFSGSALHLLSSFMFMTNKNNKNSNFQFKVLHKKETFCSMTTV